MYFTAYLNNFTYNDAITFCNDLVQETELNEGVKTNWYLPSSAELVQAFKIHDMYAFAGSAFATEELFWSSTAASSTHAFLVTAQNGSVLAPFNKLGEFPVRCASVG